MSDITVACVGAGYFSRFHYDAWSRIPNVEIVGSMDLTIEAASATGYPAFTHLETMLEATKPQLLDIITPPPTHSDFIKRALQSDVKVIICQKPFCTDMDEARKVTKLCADANVKLVIHENFRFQPWYRCMHKAIQEKVLGDVHQVTFRLRTGDGQGPNAYLDRQPYFQSMPKLLIHETGVHWIDTFKYLMGNPIGVYADLRKMNPAIKGEDAGHVIFEFADGKRALFDGNRHLDHAAENHRLTLGECLLEGSMGTIQLYGNGEVSHRAFGETLNNILLPAQEWPGFAGDCVHALQMHVIDAMMQNKPIENCAEDYLSVIEIEQAIYESAATRQRIPINL